VIFLERLSEFGLAFINFDYIQTSDQKQQNCIYKTSIFTIFCHFILDTEPKVQNLIQDDVVCIINNVCFMTNAQDTLYGGADDDTLIGGTINHGGTGYDTYRIKSSNKGVSVNDQDGAGEIYYAGVKLTGGEEIEGLKDHFRDKVTGKEYVLYSDGTLIYDNSLTIQNFDSTSKQARLDIVLEKSEDDLSEEGKILLDFLKRVCREDEEVFETVVDGKYEKNVLKEFERRFVDPSVSPTIKIDKTSLETYADTLARYFVDKELDYLAGGARNDINQDIINDADNDGFIMFNDKQINGVKTKVDENTYEDANFTYTHSDVNHYIVDKNLGEYITIENFQDGATGIELGKEKTNTNNRRNLLTCQDDLRHVEMNNRNFNIRRKVM
jgi:hypothetical protein